MWIKYRLCKIMMIQTYACIMPDNVEASDIHASIPSSIHKGDAMAATYSDNSNISWFNSVISAFEDSQCKLHSSFHYAYKRKIDQGNHG